MTETYIVGALKEMQRWAYEIHSSFLMPGAPLRIPELQESIVNDIDRSEKKRGREGRREREREEREAD